MIEKRILWGGHYAAELQSPEAYRRRRRAVQRRLGSNDVAVVLGASDARGYGDVGTFRQEPNFFYLTGVELPNAALLLERERETLFLPARRPAIEAWTGPKLGPGGDTARLLGFDAVLGRDASEVVVEARRRPVPGFAERVADAVARGGALWLRLPQPSTGGQLSEEQQLAQALRDRVVGFTVRDLSPLLTGMRLVKSSEERTLMRSAVGATAAAMKAAAAAIRPGSSEGAVEGAAFAALRAAGAEGWSFPPIVGSGVAGCVLHYDANRGTLAAGELVVVDIGARWGYYCGDLTRTFPVDGSFTRRQRELYRAVLRAYDAAVAVLRPGATLGQARNAAYAALQHSRAKGDGGRALGQFFIHGLGHFLGLETHDVGGESPELQRGMVVTVEPGIYLPGERVGIRVEDDYLITEDGAECLSAELPRDLDAVEAMVAG
ncbi:MAG: aminopeptidase P N-terminal domain-containing protein [Acidobacteriota bacterium]